MDLYLLDYNFDPDYLIDEYESLVWTENYVGHGDFTLVMKDFYLASQNLKLFKYFKQSDSKKIMKVETVSVKGQTDNGDDLVEIKGRSLEAEFYKKNNANSNPSGTYSHTGTQPANASFLVERYAINPATAQTGQAIPELSIGSIASGGTSEKRVFPRNNLYDMISPLLEEAGFGWSITRDGSASLEFNVTKGLDRTSGSIYQEYSPDMETLTNISSLESVANYRNHVRVFGTNEYVDVYAPGVSSSVSGLDRQSMYHHVVDINDGSLTTTEERNALTEIGRAVLRDNNNRYYKMIDGEVPRDRWNDTFYGLGDIVWVKDNYGDKNKMRITQQVFTSDHTGESRVPGFSLIEE